MKNEAHQCGVCDRWAYWGGHVQSGPKNLRTGETPFDNFICSHCQKEAADLRATQEALNAWGRKQRAA
jgi:predicted GNAT family acetyltransferase